MIGVYGGTFDPVHFGHLRSAVEVAEQLALTKVLMIPSARPPHRHPPHVSVQHRWQMLQLALADNSLLVADDREIKRQGLSYMYDTLASIRQEIGDQPLCLILGSDAFAQLHTWYRWRELFDLAHIVIVQRTGNGIPWSEEVTAQFVGRKVDDASVLRQVCCGMIYCMEVTRLSISATDIRARLARGHDVRYLIPDSVYRYIRQHMLYLNQSKTE